MKKSFLLVLFNTLMISLFGQQWVNLGSGVPVAPKVVWLSASDGEVTVDFSLGGFNYNKVETPYGEQNSIMVPKMASILEAGSPDLPMFAIPIIVDDKAGMRVEIDKEQYSDIQNVEIVPSKGNFSRQIDPEEVPYIYGEVYHTDAFYPDLRAQLDAPYILRDLRGQNVLVYPFAYNPVRKTLRIYTHLTLTVQLNAEHGSEPKSQQRSNKKLLREMRANYDRRFVNFRMNEAKYTFVPDAGEMMVICPEQYVEAMQPFVAWKNASGRPTKMYSLSEVGGNNATQIKSFILSHYENPDENLCYVLLVGDYDDLTPYPLGGGRSDIWFGQLEGSDYYPEVLVGRFSVESIADVENQVAKVIYYERDMPATADWLGHGLGIGSTEGAGNGHNGGESDYQHIEFIRDTLLHYTYSEVAQHYMGVGAGTNAAMLSVDFNAGVSVCNYCNHGSPTAWSVGSFSNSHINALVNDYKWPFIWSTACLNGEFNHSQPCFAEAWMRATNSATGAPTGAIGGMFSWTSQPWQPPMTGQDEMVDILCEWHSADQFHHTLGGASLNGNMKILDLHPSDQGATHNTWILFGDPSLMLRTAIPTELNVNCQPETIFLGQGELHLTAEADYALATLSVNGEVLCSAPIINGEGTLCFMSPEQTGTATLVVTGFNKVTEIRDIQIIPADGPYLTFDSCGINDDNGQADYGETLNLNLTVKNIGNESASDVQVVLTTESPFVQIVDGLAHIPTISAMEYYNIANACQIIVNETVPDGIQASFTLTCIDDNHEWESHFRLRLHAPSFTLTDFRTLNTAQPGTCDTLLVGIKNNGTSDAHHAQLQLFSSSTDMVFNETVYAIGNIPVGSTTEVMAVFTTSHEVPLGSSFEVLYLLEAEPYTMNGIELVNIGPVKETFETGDLSAFPWETLGGSQWFVDNSTANSGIYSVRSGVIGNANLTTLQVEIEVPENGQISFFKKISSEANKDKLVFYIDNRVMGEWSGEINWSREVFPVPIGTHKFKWIYMKDSNGGYGDDCCWIDDVQFPSSNIVTLLPALEVEAEVDLNQVTLSWVRMTFSENYIIGRDGNQIVVQHENVFTETQSLGTYLYSVTTVNDEHQLSIPTFVKVTIDTVGACEIHHDVQIFPNPAHDVLYISLGQAFSYQIFNCHGQQIAIGKSTGAMQVHCSGLDQGLYFIQIATGGEMFTKKFVIQ